MTAWDKDLPLRNREYYRARIQALLDKQLRFAQEQYFDYEGALADKHALEIRADVDELAIEIDAVAGEGGWR